MKKCLVITLIICCLIANSNAQRYSINKTKYDSHQYIPQIGDPYNPAISGVCSFLVPGMGQMISGEVGRGLGFLGAYASCAAIYGVGAARVTSSMNDSSNTNNGSSGKRTMFLGLAGMGVVNLWSIIDAVKVAKTNNMYVRDARETTSLQLEVLPYAETISMNNQSVTPIGLSMRITF